MSASGRSDQPGPDEQAELSREEQRDARDELSERIGAYAAEDDDGEETVDEMLEIDQTELDRAHVSRVRPIQRAIVTPCRMASRRTVSQSSSSMSMRTC